MVAISKFPKLAFDNQLYTDHSGLKWTYDASTRRWTQFRIEEDLPTVSSTEDGIITPSIYNRLVELENSLTGLTIPTFKISPGLDAYFYYFYSPDGLIDIRHHGLGQIAINVNEQKLVSYLYRYLCPGDTGITGLRGLQGDPGEPGPPEVYYNPVRSTNNLSGDIYVPVPIGTYYPHPSIANISLRFYSLSERVLYSLGSQLVYWDNIILQPSVNQEEKEIYFEFRQRIIDQIQGISTAGIINLSNIILNNDLPTSSGPILEIDINVVTEDITIINNGIRTTLGNIKVEFDRTIGLLHFDIVASWPDDVVVKARQRGPNGERGDVPVNYIDVMCYDFPNDANVRPNFALIHFRLDDDSESFYVSYARLESQDAYGLVSTDTTANATQTLPVIEGRYAAVEKIAGSVKRTTIVNNKFPEIDVGALDLQSWEPQPGCRTKRSFNSHKFDWISDTDIPACADDLKWYGPLGVRPGRYPYELVRPTEPPNDVCCQDEYFIYPQSGAC